MKNKFNIIERIEWLRYISERRDTSKEDKRDYSMQLKALNWVLD